MHFNVVANVECDVRKKKWSGFKELQQKTTEHTDPQTNLQQTLLEKGFQ